MSSVAMGTPAPFDLSLDLLIKAEGLAQALYLSPEGRGRIKRTERVWRYRPYQGGEPVTAIDWRQSSRSRVLIVREHEPILNRPIFFWTDFKALSPARGRDVALIFIALAHLLIKSERTIGWLGSPHPPTATASQIGPLFAFAFEKEAGANAPRTIALGPSVILAATQGSSLTAPALESLRAYAAQGSLCLLMNADPSPLHDEQSLPFPRGWPVYPLPPERGAEDTLPLLLEAVMAASR